MLVCQTKHMFAPPKLSDGLSATETVREPNNSTEYVDIKK